MAKVRFYELAPAKELRATEKEINERLAAAGHEATVRLVRDREGKIGYSIAKVSPDGGKKLLEAVHRAVCDALGRVRGRPRAAVPTRQIKCRLPESICKRLELAAKGRKISTSRLLAELAAKHVA